VAGTWRRTSRSIEPESAKRRAVRHGWRRVPGNEGRALVAVPRTALPDHPHVLRTDATLPENCPGDVPRNIPQGYPGDRQEDTTARRGDASLLSLAVIDLRAALRSVEQRLVEANERAGRAEARADAAQGLADRRGEELAELRERAGRAEGEAATLREQLKAERNRSVTQMREVEAARDAAKFEMAEWTAGGPFARAVRAFLNRRGRG